MIWSGGKLVADEALKISALDRTFEHGLGLFETLRTWKGRAPLLDRHLARLTHSAETLGLSLDAVNLPDAGAVSALMEAAAASDDMILRITLTGGLSDKTGATLWMRTAPLPEPVRHGGAVVDLGSWWVDDGDELIRHKTLNSWSRRRAYETARTLGYDEVLSMTRDFRIWEGSRTNVFVVRDSALITPTTDGPILRGVMRGLVLELAKELPLDIDVTPDVSALTLEHATEVFLTNSVRGLIPVTRAGVFKGNAPGEWTRRLSILVADWLSTRTSEQDDEA
jgi:branched-subunit amino acid aminotransferase/4-amino-4-deoxychorismate lyase